MTKPDLKPHQTLLGQIAGMDIVADPDVPPHWIVLRSGKETLVLDPSGSARRLFPIPWTQDQFTSA